MGSNSVYKVKKKISMWLGCLLLLAISSCSRDLDEVGDIGAIRIAVVPVQSEAHLRKKYKPFLEYIKIHTGIKAELMIPASYSELLQWFDEKKIDLARFGGVTYVKAHIKSNATPIVMRYMEGGVRSVVLVAADNPASNLMELQGSSFSFGSSLSTSGHYMPRYFFQQKI